MIKNYLNIVLRNFRKNVGYNLVNLLGLSIGFAVFILISTYVHHQKNFENFHQNANRIFRPTYIDQPGKDFRVQWARIPYDFINHLPEEIPEIEKLIRFQNHDPRFIRIGTEKFQPKYAYTTDADVFEVFSFELLAGNPQTALAEPNSIVLSESLARKYFGNTNIIGQSLFFIQ